MMVGVKSVIEKGEKNIDTQSLKHSSISAVCRGRNKKHLNYKWEFADENIR